jgi:hydrogenase-4 component H
MMGLLEVLLRSLRSPVVTGSYPPHADVPDRGHRGTPELQPQRCQGSGDCAEICPTGAIVVEPRGDAESRWRLDYGLCVFCGRCAEVCPNEAIAATAEFELAARRRGEVVAIHLVKRGER